MATGFGALGTIATYSAASGNTAVSYPAVNSQELIVLVLLHKLGPTAALDLSADGWTSRGFISHGTTASANDAGSMRGQVFTRVATGSESGSYTVVWGTQPTAGQAFMYTLTKGVNEAWDTFAFQGVARTATTTSWSVTAASDPGLASGDFVSVFGAVPTDLNTASSAGVLTATGLTPGSATERIAHNTSSTGTDSAIWFDSFQPSAGTSSAAPTYTSTLTSGTNLYGVGIFFRARVAAVTVVTGDAALSANGSLTAEGVPVVPGVVALSGDGALAATAEMTAVADAALSSQSDQASAGLLEAIASAALSGDGALSSDGVAVRFGDSSLGATGDLVSVGLQEAIAAAALTAESNLAATAASGGTFAAFGIPL